jgi:hypothetical protein
MKVNFAKRVFYRKKSERLEGWVFYSGMFCLFGYTLYYYLKKPVAPSEDPYTYQRHLLLDLMSDKVSEEIEVSLY